MSMFGRPKAAPEPVKEPEKPTAPSALTKEDVATMLEGAMGGIGDRLAGALGGLREGVEALASRPVTVTPAEGPVAVAPGITDDEIETALMGGPGAAKTIRALVDRAVNTQAETLVRDRIAPLETTGLTALADLTRKISLEHMPNYKRFKTEIDAKLSNLDAATATNPNALAMVYHATIGEHKDELDTEAKEAWVRQMQEAAAGGGEGGQGAAAPGGSTGVTKRDEKPVPTAEVLGGSEALISLSHKGNGGMDQDEYARGMGYKDWDSYIKQGEELEAAETANNA